MVRRKVLVALGVVGVLIVGAVVFVVGRDDGEDPDEVVAIDPEDLLSDDERELLAQANPDPGCASEPTPAPDDDELVALSIVRVDGTCLDATTEYLPADEVDKRRAELNEDPSVIAAAVVPESSPDEVDDRREDQWALDALGAPEDSAELPWPDATGVVVAVIDTGVDASHPDLADAVVGRRRYPGEGDPDPDGHGTASAGIIAARRDNGGMIGVAPAASILDVPVKLRGKAERNPDNWVVGLTWAVNHGADVVNMSLGAALSDWEKPENQDSLKLAVAVVEFAVTSDVVVVASAGNCGNRDDEVKKCPEQDQRKVPAALPGVIGVGALQKDADIPGYSSRNEDVDLVAPGGGADDDMIVTTALEGEYEDFNGTSAASPHVAAAVAAVRFAAPDATPDQIGPALIEAADPEGVSEQDRDNIGAGRGLVDIVGTIDLLRATPTQPSEDLAARTQAAFVQDGTLYAFDGAKSHPVREVGDDHSVQSVTWSDDHTSLVGADDDTLFSWAGPGSEVVETACDGCALNEIVYLDDAAVTDPGDAGRTGDLVVTIGSDGTLTRYDAHSLEPQGTVALAPVAESGVGSENSAGLVGDTGGRLLAHTTGGVDGEDTLWLVDPFSGEATSSHDVVGNWGGHVAVNARGDRVAYESSASDGGTCADIPQAIVLAGADLSPVATPDLPRNHVFDEMFFNGDVLYATVERIAPADGQCPTDGSAGLWRTEGETWQQVDASPLATARPLEGLTKDDPTGWLVVTEDEQGVLGDEELGPIDLGVFTFLGLWTTPTHEEVTRSGVDGGSGGGGGVPKSTEGAIARFEEYLHALGTGDIGTICEIAGPAAQIAEDDGFGPCEQTFGIVLDMISEDQHEALRSATVDPDLVETVGPDEVRIPVEAVVSSITFTEEELGTSTVRHQDGDWFIVD